MAYLQRNVKLDIIIPVSFERLRKIEEIKKAGYAKKTQPAGGWFILRGF